MEGNRFIGIDLGRKTYEACAICQTGAAVAFLGYIGDGRRFATASHVSYYIGMVPRIDDSGETTRLGHITKSGIAIVAVARRILELMYTLVTHREYYRHSSLSDRLQKLGRYRLVLEGTGGLDATTEDEPEGTDLADKYQYALLD
jgi:Transposase IS116/IS110/IS902 family